MIWNPFQIVSKGFLGVDIGTFSIKIVEMSRSGRRKKLDNYGEIRASALYEKPFRTFEKSTLTVSSNDVIRAVKAVLQEAKIKSKKAYFAIPDFSTFFTTITLPAMTKEELPQAVNFEARQHIPLPLDGVTLDWQIIEREAGPQSKSGKVKILLVAVPNEVIKQYQEIAQAAGLELLSLEAEVFSLARALIKESELDKAVALIDIGARSTTISVIDKGMLKISHSFDTSGNDLTNVISKGLNVDYNQAEGLKKKYGLSKDDGDSRKIILPLIDLVLSEAEKIFASFFESEKKQVNKIILAGGSALLSGLPNYFNENLKIPTEVATPFSDIYYPPVLENILKESGPSYSIAVGAAINGLK